LLRNTLYILDKFAEFPNYTSKFYDIILFLNFGKPTPSNKAQVEIQIQYLLTQAQAKIMETDYTIYKHIYIALLDFILFSVKFLKKTANIFIVIEFLN